MAMSASHVLSAGSIAARPMRASGRAATAAAGSVASEMRILPAGKAVSFVPQRDTVLRISEGTAWITLGLGLSNEASLQAGDLVLHAGHSVVLKAGQSVVIESKRQDALVYHFPKNKGGQPNLDEQPARWFTRFQWGKTDGSMFYNI